MRRASVASTLAVIAFWALAACWSSVSAEPSGRNVYIEEGSDLRAGAVELPSNASGSAGTTINLYLGSGQASDGNQATNYTAPPRQVAPVQPNPPSSPPVVPAPRTSPWEILMILVLSLMAAGGVTIGLVAFFRWNEIAAQRREAEDRIRQQERQIEAERRALELREAELAMLRQPPEAGEEASYRYSSGRGQRSGTLRPANQ